MLTAANIKATARTIRDMPHANTAVVGSETAAKIVETAAASLNRDFTVVVDTAFAGNHMLIYRGEDEKEIEKVSESIFAGTDLEDTQDIPVDEVETEVVACDGLGEPDDTMAAWAAMMERYSG